jgi:hypothetical protein
MNPGARHALGAVLFAVAGSAACDDPGVECECADPTIFITVPADRAAHVADVQLSGQGCATSPVACVEPVGSGCAKMAFRGTAVGSCSVEVQLDSGPATFDETFELVRYPCCPGVYAELASGNTVEVPDLPDDGGAAE